MKLPADTLIAREKLTHYLLVPQARGDKSAFLARAGYNLATADRLLDDLHALVQTREAAATETNEFGQYFEIRADLSGPNGVKLSVVTVWMREALTDRTKFITLLPDRKRP